MNTKEARKIIKANGFEVRRGGYVGTCDDRIDGWYLDSFDRDYLDRRGPGFKTLREAAERAAEFPAVSHRAGK